MATETAAAKAAREKSEAEAKTAESASAATTQTLTEGNAPQRSPGKIIRKLPPGSSRRRVKKARREGPFVQYVGEASRRDIAAADWATLPGVEPKKKPKEDEPGNGFFDVSWTTQNERLIETSMFSDSQLDYLLIDDMQDNGAHSFLEVDWNGEGEDAALVQVEYSDEDEDDEE